MLSKNIDRIAAEEDIRRAQIGFQVQSGEGFKDLVEGLRKQLGKVVEHDEGKLAMRATRDVLSEEDKAALNSIGRLG